MTYKLEINFKKEGKEINVSIEAEDILNQDWNELCKRVISLLSLRVEEAKDSHYWEKQIEKTRILLRLTSV